MEEYWQGFREGVDPVGVAINPSTAVFVHMVCAPSDEEAQARARGIHFFSYGITTWSARGRDRSKVNHLNSEFQERASWRHRFVDVQLRRHRPDWLALDDP